jgi:hypothetical protein
MLIGVFGTPSPLTLWTLHAVRIIVQVAHPNYSFISAVRFEDLKAAWNSIDANARQQVLFYSDCPEAPIADMFASMDVPILWIADDAEDIVPFCSASRLMQVEHAIRFMTQSAATLSQLFRAKYLWQIRKEFYRCRVVEFVGNIVRFFGLPAHDGDFATIMEYLTPGNGGDSEVTVGQEILRVIDKARRPGTYEFNNAGERRLFDLVAPQYDAILRNEAVDRIVWPREIFCDWDRPGQLVSSVQEMVGRARRICICHGAPGGRTSKSRSARTCPATGSTRTCLAVVSSSRESTRTFRSTEPLHWTWISWCASRCCRWRSALNSGKGQSREKYCCDRSNWSDRVNCRS